MPHRTFNYKTAPERSKNLCSMLLQVITAIALFMSILTRFVKSLDIKLQSINQFPLCFNTQKQTRRTVRKYNVTVRRVRAESHIYYLGF